VLHGADAGNGRGWSRIATSPAACCAPYNLTVPPCHFISEQSVRIGENPPDVTWDFGDIQQI
jgi:hypothetical protein